MKWARGEEQTFLESELAEAVHPKCSGGCYEMPDGPRLNVHHVLRELNINEVTLWRWCKRCPPLGGKPLKYRWDKSPDTGKRQKPSPERISTRSNATGQSLTLIAG